MHIDPERLHVAVLTRAVAPIHGVGGLERHVADLLAHLLRRGVRITLITRRPPDSTTALDNHDRLTVRFVPYRTFPLAGRRGTTAIDRSTAYLAFGGRAGRLAADLVRGGGIQIVHGLGAASLGYARARLADWYETVPFVFNPQGMEEFGSTGSELPMLKRVAYAPLRSAVRLCAKAADRVIATDRSLIPAVLEHLRVQRDKVALIPNAIDLDRLDRLAGAADAPRVRERAGLGPDDLLLLSVGRLEENKGFHKLLQALAMLQGNDGQPTPLGERWKCAIVGDGPNRATLEQLASRTGLANRVIFPGRVGDTELHAWYRAATLFVHPTLYEGSSLVTLEAMAHRLPVVATNAGGLPDKVKPGTNGWLVQPGDSDSLARAIREAVAVRHTLSSMGENSRALAEREFSWTAVAERMLTLYAEMLSSSAAWRR